MGMKIEHGSLIEKYLYKDRICEMMNTNNSNQIVVPNDPRIDMDIITKDDDDPQFVIVEVLRAGIVSKTNHRRYNNNNVREIAELIVGTEGFLGHEDPSKKGFEFRDPQSICVGAIVDHMPDGLDRCIMKTYLFKNSPLREWIPKSIAAGNPITVSINATADIMRNYSSDIIDVVHISELSSVDWANPGTEGVDTAKALAIVQELQQKGGSYTMDDMNPSNVRDIIKNVTVAELRAYNPHGIEGIIQSITVQELQQHNKALYDKIVEDNKVNSLHLKVSGKEENVAISEMQGIVNRLEDKVKELEGQIETAKVSEMRTRIIAQNVPTELVDKISPRITGDTEDEVKKSIEAEVAYISEMSGSNNFSLGNKPIGRNADNSDDLKDSVLEMFGINKKKGEE